jgi:hypothetical protein
MGGLFDFLGNANKATGIDWFTKQMIGTGDKMQSTMAPWQQQMAQQYSQGIEKNKTYQGGNDFLQKLLGGDSSAFQNFERPYQERFEQETVPGLTNMFAGLGTGGGALSGSGFQNSLAQAGRGLSSDLANMRSSMQMNALPQALNYAQQPFTNQLGGMNVNTMANQPGQEGMLQQLIMMFAKMKMGGG